jgi:hypothetical protein
MAEAIEDAKAFLAKMLELNNKTKALDINKEQENVEPGEDDAPSHVGITPVGPPKDSEAAANRAREHNWATPQAYDYSAYGRDENDENDRQQKNWASTAVKYEWKDEYGDVPPRNEELEKELFQSVWNMTQGENMQVLDIKVVTEGPEEVFPILRVSLSRVAVPN